MKTARNTQDRRKQKKENGEQAQQHVPTTPPRRQLVGNVVLIAASDSSGSDTDSVGEDDHAYRRRVPTKRHFSSEAKRETVEKETTKKRPASDALLQHSTKRARSKDATDQLNDIGDALTKSTHKHGTEQEQLGISETVPDIEQPMVESPELFYDAPPTAQSNDKNFKTPLRTPERFVAVSGVRACSNILQSSSNHNHNNHSSDSNSGSSCAPRSPVFSSAVHDTLAVNSAAREFRFFPSISTIPTHFPLHLFSYIWKAAKSVTAPRKSTPEWQERGRSMGRYLAALDDPIVQAWLEHDSHTDKYTFAMAFVYLLRKNVKTRAEIARFFFPALYLAYQIEDETTETDDTREELIVVDALWNGSSSASVEEVVTRAKRPFLKRVYELWSLIHFRAMVSLKLCEKTIRFAPKHEIWQRLRQLPDYRVSSTEFHFVPKV